MAPKVASLAGRQGDSRNVSHNHNGSYNRLSNSPQPFAAHGLMDAIAWLQAHDRVAGSTLYIRVRPHPSLAPLIQACLNTGVHLHLLPPHSDVDSYDHVIDATDLPEWHQADSALGPALEKAATAMREVATQARSPCKVQPPRGQPNISPSLLNSAGAVPDAVTSGSVSGQVIPGVVVWASIISVDLVKVLRACISGYDILLSDGFDPRTIATYWSQLQGISLVPTMLHRLLRDQPAAMTAGPLVLLGGAPCDIDLWQQAAHLTPRRCYAASECGGTVAGEDHRSSLGTSGWLLPGVTAQVASSGELLLQGVLADPLAWWPSGDRGTLHEDGSLSILGRMDQRIISGGLNLDPDVIAEQLNHHPAIQQAVVVGIPDPEWGQQVAAVLIRTPDAAET